MSYFSCLLCVTSTIETMINHTDLQYRQNKFEGGVMSGWSFVASLEKGLLIAKIAILVIFRFVSPLALGAVSSIDEVTTWIINEHRAWGVMHQWNQSFNIPPQAFEFQKKIFVQILAPQAKKLFKCLIMVLFGQSNGPTLRKSSRSLF